MPLLSDVLAMVVESSADDWSVVSTTFGPTYLDELAQMSNASASWLEVSSHHGLATYRNDVQLGMAWGLSRRSDDRRSFEWANFPDPLIYPSIVDVFWNGMIVDRFDGLVVDGGRVVLPFPDLDRSVTPSQEFIAAEPLAVFRLVHQIERGGYDFDEYVQRTGLPVR